MITHIELGLLPPDLREAVLAKYRVALMDPARKLTMLEAAWLYGYDYQTVRRLVCYGQLRSTGQGKNRRVSHAAVRAYRQLRKKSQPTSCERTAQLKAA